MCSVDLTPRVPPNTSLNNKTILNSIVLYEAFKGTLRDNQQIITQLNMFFKLVILVKLSMISALFIFDIPRTKKDHESWFGHA
jgi:hypothetical protein